MVFPASQRRGLAELTEDLDLTSGDRVAKRSAFWMMLLLSAVIAAAGVMADSTATVIGAMIVAPLATPIMGVGLAIVLRDAHLARQAVRHIVVGALCVVLLGVLFALAVPGSIDLSANSQVAGRTSPALLDLLAALATGAAGAVALARRDVAAVLPGVAIAISLVPPLVVVGVCLGQGAPILALGALVLFASNFVALVLMGTLVFHVAGYGVERAAAPDLSGRRAWLAVTGLLLVVLVPLAGNTAVTYAVGVWSQRIRAEAQGWLGATAGARVEGVDLVSTTFRVRVRAPSELPPVGELAARLRQQVPGGFSIVVSSVVGQESEAAAIAP